VSDAPEQIFMNPDMDVIDRSDIDRLILALRRPHGSDIGNKAADLIHSLTEALAEARILSMIEPTGRAALDAVVAERIKELEAKLAKAVEAAFTEGFLAGTEDGWMNNPRIKVEWKHSRSRATLRELKRGKDE
jgi:hypothetical protein